jgi:hypothetical protein
MTLSNEASGRMSIILNGKHVLLSKDASDLRRMMLGQAVQITVKQNRDALERLRDA